jgi:hypothetical protein
MTSNHVFGAAIGGVALVVGLVRLLEHHFVDGSATIALGGLLVLVSASGLRARMKK